MSDSRADRAAVWIARGVVVAMAIVYAWYTWGHWGDLQIDSGREMYVPVDLLRGKLLYRDIWYQYGPLTPYLQALAFELFGINLNVLWVIGMILVISSALLLFEIGRNFELVLPAAMAPAIFFLAESFPPSIFSFVFPYSYTASMAAFFGLACLFFTIKHAITGRLRWLLFAALCTSLALLTKQEFGLACLAVLGFEAVASSFARHSWRELTRNCFTCAAGLAPTVLVYGFLVWKISAKTIFIDNWVMTPGTYTMRTMGQYTMARQGVRFGLNEWSLAAFGVAVSLTLWFVISYANAFAIRRFGLSRLRHFVLIVGAEITLALIIITLGSSAWPGLPWFIAQIVFPKGIYLIGCAFMILAIWNVWQTRGQAADLAKAALGIYAVLVGIRAMMEMWSGGYAVFFNAPVFLVFAIVVARVVARGGLSLDVQRRRLLVGRMLSAEALILVLGLLPLHSVVNTPMKTDFGTIYTEADRATLFPQIISFMKNHTRNGKDILVLPDSASLYYFSGMQSPSRWYEAQPGVLDPQQELTLINDADSSHVQYVLLCNRRVTEFGIAPFGIGYDQSIYKWLVANYIKVSQFGPRADLLPKNIDLRGYEPYVMEVYEKKAK
ncbi:MAG: hypothetical protein WBQ86_16910 [Candidatus Binatus sp.]